MDVVSGDRLVTDYLSRLHATAWQLPADRRTRLVHGTRDRLQDELGEQPAADGARAALARLGTPQDLVQAELAEGGQVSAAPVRSPSVWGSREVAAVLLLAIGGLALPVLGPVVGLVVAWFAERWSVAQRLLAALIYLLTVLLLAAVGSVLDAPTVWAFLVPVAGVVPAGYLALEVRRAATRAHEEPIEG